MSRFLNILAAVLFFLPLPAQAGKLGLGRPALPAEIAAWDKDVRPDGHGLPAGQGSVAQGEEIYLERCAACHGDFGEGVDRWPVLAGGQDTLTDERPIKTIGSYWPYLSTAFDYIQRTMPYGDAATLGADETYAILAYLLYMNDIVDDEGFTLSRENFTSITLPNQPSFRNDDRPRVEYPLFRDRCMKGCKDHVEITARAANLDVTPK